MLVRSGSLTETMSRYLVQRIEKNPLIQVLCGSAQSGFAANWQQEVLPRYSS
jgi:hypothetical protein